MSQILADTVSAAGPVEPHITSPALQDLLAHWMQRRGERSMPARDDLAEETLSQALSDLILFELSCACCADDASAATPTGGLVSGMSAPYHEVIRLAQPIYGRREDAAGGAIERLLLPLSRNGSDVDTILVGVQRQR